jgi:hypothetical protein
MYYQRLKALPIHRANLKTKLNTKWLNGKFLKNLGYNIEENLFLLDLSNYLN